MFRGKGIASADVIVPALEPRPSNVRRAVSRLTRRVYKSTTLRVWCLRSLSFFGVKRFQARSSVNEQFVCHIGDFVSELPFLNVKSHQKEIAIMTAWCEQFERPVMFDVGGNVGFISTQIALLLREKKPTVYSFEPVPKTFQRLVSAIELLNLEAVVNPICVALSSSAGITRLSYSESNSMLAQCFDDVPNARAGNKVVTCAVLTMDQVAAEVRKVPSLIKIDVEGYEVHVLKGAAETLSRRDAAVCFELNPLTLSESGVRVDELMCPLKDYDFYYIDDFEGQRLPFGERITNIEMIDWVCNLFAVPKSQRASERWERTIKRADDLLAYFNGATNGGG